MAELDDDVPERLGDVRLVVDHEDPHLTAPGEVARVGSAASAIASAITLRTTSVRSDGRSRASASRRSERPAGSVERSTRCVSA